jgi:hypothetical protein
MRSPSPASTSRIWYVRADGIGCRGLRTPSQIGGGNPHPEPGAGAPSSVGPAGASRVAYVLREMILLGAVSAPAFKALHVARGGTRNSTHAFDCYFIEKTSSRHGYVPRKGSHALLARRGQQVVWVGSPGDTFEARAESWLRGLVPTVLDRFLVLAESEMLAAGSLAGDTGTDTGALEVARKWFALAERVSLARSREMLAVDPTHAVRAG